jgi:acetyl esterase
MNPVSSPPPPSALPAALAAPAPKRPMWERDIAELRQEEEELSLAGAGEPEAVVSVTEISAQGVPAWLYWPRQYRKGVFVWLHGGAWMLGSPVSHDPLARAFANRIGCAVLSVDYRRAPEHRYPAAIDDAWTAICWAADQFGHVAVGGDSSGGNLAAAVALRAHDYGLALALQLLVYPVLDGDLYAKYREDFAKRNSDPADPEALGVDWRDNLRWIWQQYAPEPAQRLAPEASPMHARSLAGLAPALLITAGRDILRAESEQYASRLANAGVLARLRNYPGASHGFFHLLAAAPDARDAVGWSAEAVRHAFSRDAAGEPGNQRPRAVLGTAGPLLL